MRGSKDRHSEYKPVNCNMLFATIVFQIGMQHLPNGLRHKKK